MIELQTLVSDLTIAEFIELCASSIGMLIFIFCCSVFIIVYLFYDIIDDFIVEFKIRKKETQEEENNADI